MWRSEVGRWQSPEIVVESWVMIDHQRWWLEVGQQLVSRGDDRKLASS